MPDSFFSELIAQITERGRALFPRQRKALALTHRPDIIDLCQALLSRRGEASGVTLAAEILARWEELDGEEKRRFLVRLVTGFGPVIDQLEVAITQWKEMPNEITLRNIQSAVEPRRQELIRRLNLAPGGTRRLVSMREDILRYRKENSELNVLDIDFGHLFSSWFNRGFLVLKRIDWNTSANILEKIIRYEAVHAIGDWEELRRRIEPEDRRLFAFFHPQMIDEPLIFVEVALTRNIPVNINPLLAADRELVQAAEATTAVFYSISNCQEGLRGVSFGNFLIKQVVEDLKRELPRLKTFVTLSPVPGFAKWLAEQYAGSATWLTAALREALAPEQNGWEWDAERRSRAAPAMQIAAAHYFLNAKTAEGKPVDPVARFHLGNGASLGQVNPFGDLSPNGFQKSRGLMVNYLYDLASIEANHESFAEAGEVIAARAIRDHLRGNFEDRAEKSTGRLSA
jgi:malonyl-CoA decarboxylase